MIVVRIVEENPLIEAALRQMVQQEDDFELNEDETEAFIDTKENRRSDKKGRTHQSVTLLGLNDDNPLLGLSKLRLRPSGSNKVIVLTNSRDRKIEKMALEYGADGVASKSTKPKELAALVRSTSAGYQSVPAHADDDPFFMLNETEENIIRLSCLGLQRNEIAQALSLSEGTIKRYVGHILAQTEYDNLNHLALDMLAQGTIHPKLTWAGKAES